MITVVIKLGGLNMRKQAFSLILIIILLITIASACFQTTSRTSEESQTKSFFTSELPKEEEESTITPITNAESDEDYDGLTLKEEEKYGTDPHNPDSDGDGIPDGDEVLKYSTNPLDPDPVFAYALKKLPERDALIFKNLKNYSKTIANLINLYASLSKSERDSEDVRSLLREILKL